MEKENNEYLDLAPEKEVQEETENLKTGFEIDFGNSREGLEGIPTMDLGIGLTDF